MNLPDVYQYYIGLLINQMKYWFIPNTYKMWLNIEKEVLKGYDLFALSVAYTLLPKATVPPYLTIKSALTAWKYMLNKTQLTKYKVQVHVA